ncbi:MAG: hypothetical protein U5L46_07475 [Agrobacterium sp.]|nr:hypothetical protein [Agrobacterium sp.]
MIQFTMQAPLRRIAMLLVTERSGGSVQTTTVSVAPTLRRSQTNAST